MLSILMMGLYRAILEWFVEEAITSHNRFEMTAPQVRQIDTSCFGQLAQRQLDVRLAGYSTSLPAFKTSQLQSVSRVLYIELNPTW